MARYTIVLHPEPEEGGYSVTVPALRGCTTQGDTFEEAVANAHEAIAGWLDTLADLGEPIPVEDARLAVAGVEVDLPAMGKEGQAA